MIEVSVIIPTYNRSPTLGRAIRSVLDQDGVALEVWVVDDGSTDGTGEMIAREFPSVSYLFQENRGPASARNHGVHQASGRWIAFLDSDDVWEKGKLRAQLGFFRQHPEYRICQTEEIWIRNGKRVNPMKKHQKFGGWIFEQCLPLCIVSPSAVMMERELFEEMDGFDESYPACEDYEFWLRIASRHPIGLIERPWITKYGGCRSQRSRQFPAMDRFRIRALVKILESNSLKPADRNAARKILAAKSQIFIRGALKRNRLVEAKAVEELTGKILGSFQEQADQDSLAIGMDPKRLA